MLPVRPSFAATIFALFATALSSIASAEEESMDGGIDDDWADLEAPIEDPMYESEVLGYAIAPTDESTGFGQTIKVAEETRRYTTVSDVVSNAVGVQVRRVGGLNSYGVASIRGSTPGQVPVYLDGVLLNSSGFSSVNLGDISLDGLESVEVYRGSAPIDFGTPGIGGVISLRSRPVDIPSSEVSLTYGSWDTARLLAIRKARIGNVGALAMLTISGSMGDFEYLNRNGTLLNEDDDVIQRRENNHHVAYDALLKLDGSIGEADWTLVNDLSMRNQGVPGIESLPTSSTSLRTLRDTASARVEVPLDQAMNLSVELGYLTMREDFDDSQNEIGVGAQRSLARIDSGSGAIQVEIDAADEDTIALRLDGRYERMDVEDLRSSDNADPKQRVCTSLAVENRFHPGEDLLLSAALRLEQHHGLFGGGPVPGTTVTQEATTYDDFFFQPSIGVRYQLLEGLHLRLNAGRYVRAPDLAELFGDRGSVMGNPELKPETALNADVGLTLLLLGKGPLSLARFEAVAFGSRVEDLIAYIQNSQSTVRPENVSKADITGTETSFRLKLFDMVGLYGNYTYLHAVNRSDYEYYRGKRLPGRPAHEIYGKIDLETVVDRLAGKFWFDVDFAGTNYLDQANLMEDTLARLFLGLGVQIEHLPSRLTFTLELRNLLDTITVKDDDGRRRPVRDFEAFPLPGRTMLATINWRT